MMKRKSGVLMPIFSLPSPYGIGGFGKEAYNFIDYLKTAGQKIWQILPLVQTGYGDSPYSSVCSYSFNPYFISPETLCDKKLITKDELNGLITDNERIDYGFLYNTRFALLKKAFSRFNKKDRKFNKFLTCGKFDNYALFMLIREKNSYKPFYEWEDKFKFRDKEEINKIKEENKDDFLFWQFIQFESYLEWQDVKKHANKKGIEILGDIPLYVALDSVDVWENPKLYNLNENLTPKKVAGVPPDYFCKDGQLWGNPVYNYEYLQETNFSWWVERVKNALNIYDYVRIDHFRGLDRFYQVDANAENAINGEWVKVPSKELFTVLNNNIDKNRIIAEDLGIIDDSVRETLKFAGYFGMKVLSFAFNGDENNLYLPKNITENSVCYTGTHDNDTLMGLVENSTKWDYDNLINGVKESLKEENIEKEIENDKDLADAIIELGFKSKSTIFIMPFADILYKKSEYRINVPGVQNGKNWTVRYKKEDFSTTTAKRLKELSINYNR